MLPCSELTESVEFVSLAEGLTVIVPTIASSS